MFLRRKNPQKLPEILSITERYNSLTKREDRLKAESEAATAKINKLQTSISQHQKDLETQRNSASSSKEKIRQNTNTINNLEQEKRILKESQERSKKEIERLVAEKSSHQKMLDDIQLLVSSKERGDSELKQRLTLEIGEFSVNFPRIFSEVSSVIC